MFFSRAKHVEGQNLSVSYAEVAQEPSLSSEAANACGKCTFSMPRYSTNNLGRLLTSRPCDRFFRRVYLDAISLSFDSRQG